MKQPPRSPLAWYAAIRRERSTGRRRFWQRGTDAELSGRLNTSHPSAPPPPPASRSSLWCPVCRYTLHGLPSTHRCPECGFEYDPYTSVFRLYDWQTGYAATTACVLIGIALAADSLPRSWSLRSALPALIAGGLSCLVVGAVAVRYLRRPTLLIMNAAGITWYSARRIERFIAWSEFDHARYNMLRQRVEFVDQQGQSIQTCKWKDLGHRLVAPRCLARLNDLKKVYDPASEAGTSEPSSG